MFRVFSWHFLCMFLAFSWQSLAFPWHFFGIFLAFASYGCEFSEHSYVCPIIFKGFHIFQGFFFVFCRDPMLVLVIIAFPYKFLRFLDISLAFSWYSLGIVLAFFHGCSSHLLSIVVSFLTIPVYVPSFSKDSIFQGFFFVFCRDWMLVLLIVAFPCNS